MYLCTYMNMSKREFRGRIDGVAWRLTPVRERVGRLLECGKAPLSLYSSTHHFSRLPAKRPLVVCKSGYGSRPLTELILAFSCFFS